MAEIEFELVFESGFEDAIRIRTGERGPDAV